MTRLFLAVDNDRNNVTKTCRTHCNLFDDNADQCAAFPDMDVNDPMTPRRCMLFDEEPLPDIEDVKDMKVELIDDDFTVEMNGESFLEIASEKEDERDSNYPLQPDIHPQRDDAIWYVAPDKSFGCWIVNHSKKRFITTDTPIEEGWAPNIYKSPVPLHNHNASDSLKSRMCWYVDEEGYGQYVLLHKGEMKKISDRSKV